MKDARTLTHRVRGRGRPGRLPIAVLAVSLLALFGPALVSAASQTVSVQSAPNVFDAKRVTISVGETVTWVVGPGNVHTVTSGTYNASGVHADGLFDSGVLTTGSDFAFTFTAAGDYPYVCTIHADSGMTGTIVVQGVDGPPSVGPMSTAAAPDDPVVGADPGIGVIVAGLAAALVVVVAVGLLAVRRRS